MSENIDNQYDFFKKVNLDANGNIGVVISGGTGGATVLNDLTDVNTGLPIPTTQSDDGRLLYYDFASGLWVSSEEVNIGTVVIDGKKSTAGTIAKGLPVYLVGFDADIHTVELADATSSATMPIIGFTAESFNDTDAKHIITFGKLTGIDTSSTVSTLNPNGETWAVNDALYMSTTPGGLTKVRPTGGTTEIQRVAKILKVDATGGQIFIYNTARTAGLPNLTTDNIWIGDVNGNPSTTNFSTLLGSTLTDGNGTVVNGTAIDLGGTLTEANTILSGDTTNSLDIGGNTAGANLAQARINASSFQANNLTAYDGTGTGTAINSSPAGFTITQNLNSGVTVTNLTNGGSIQETVVDTNFNRSTFYINNGSVVANKATDDITGNLGIVEVEHNNVEIGLFTSGGTLTSLKFDEITSGKTLFYDNRATTTGIEYAADYSAGFTNRTLVDKAYVDNAITTPTLNRTFTLDAPTASDDVTVFRTDVAITVQEVIAVSVGATPSTTYQLKHSTDRSAVGNNLTTSSTTTSITTGDVATLSDATIPADSFIWFESTAASGTGVILSIDIRYTED